MQETKANSPPTNPLFLQPENVEPRRIDSAHPIRGRENVEVSGGDHFDGTNSLEGNVHESEALQRHAETLAEDLRAKQRQLDRREAQLNRQLADAENEIRLSRLSIQDREEELDEKSAHLNQRQTEIEEQMASLSAAELAFQRDLAERQEQLDSREQETLLCEARLVDLKKRLEHQQQRLGEEAQQVKLKEQQLAEQRRSLLAEMQDRRDRLAAAEQLLQQQAEAAEVERARLRAQLEEERKDLARRQRESADAQRTESAKLVEHRQQLERRAVSLDEKQAVVQEMYEQLQAVHGEALEMRLAGEQVWARLRSSADPEIFAELVTDVRAKIAGQQRLADQRLAETKDQLRQIAVRLAAREEEIGKKQVELRRWQERRQHELEEQAARLVAREQEIERLRRQHTAERERWEDERQQELAHLRKLVQDGPAETTGAGPLCQPASRTK